MRIKGVGLLIALLLVIAAAGHAIIGRSNGAKSAPAAAPVQGGAAPDFVLKDLDGKSVSLKDYRGKTVVVLNFWTTQCGYCLAEMPDFSEFHREYSDRGVVVLGIDIGEPEERVRNTVSAKGVAFPVLLDSSGRVAESYGVLAVPTTFVLDKSGIIRSRIVGMTTKGRLQEEVKPLL